jgi:hypothetical protein
MPKIGVLSGLLCFAISDEKQGVPALLAAGLINHMTCCCMARLDNKCAVVAGAGLPD